MRLPITCFVKLYSIDLSLLRELQTLGYPWAAEQFRVFQALNYRGGAAAFAGAFREQSGYARRPMATHFTYHPLIICLLNSTIFSYHQARLHHGDL
jgi:hypothetical protein